YHANGFQASVGHLYDGQRCGSFTAWSGAGKVREIGAYTACACTAAAPCGVPGTPSGFWTTFDDDGRKTSQGMYLERGEDGVIGTRVGGWTFWDGGGRARTEMFPCPREIARLQPRPTCQ